MRNLHVCILAAVLAAIGLGLAAYKVAVIELPSGALSRDIRRGDHVEIVRLDETGHARLTLE